ncbi:MAG TPA: TolC family protein [Gemmatimonadota bacterium]|nr:TolC family protein [Gemmatimonadota bacterium]
MRLQFVAALFAAPTLGVVGGISAQEGAADAHTPGSTFTLTDALELAERHNPDIARARNAVGAAGAGRLARRAAFLPGVTASTSFDVTRIRRFTTTDVFGDPTEREQAVQATTRGAQQGVFLDVAIFDGGETLAGARAANARYRSSQAAVEATLNHVRADVTRAYCDLLERHRTVDVERLILKARQRDVETTERLFRTVAADQIDVLGARIEARRQEAALATAEEAAEAARLELARVVGTGIDSGARLETPSEPFHPDAQDVEALVRGALASHPEIRELAADLDAAEVETWNDGWLAYLPRVAATASYRRSEVGGTEQPLLELDPRDTATSFGLQLTLPLFDRFARRVARAQASSAAADAREALRARRLAVEGEVRSRFLDLKAAWRELQVENETAAMARERVDLARRKYEIGAIDFIRLQEAVDGATAAERSLVRRRFDYHRAMAELERAAGRSIVPAAGEGAEPDTP